MNGLFKQRGGDGGGERDKEREMNGLFKQRGGDGGGERDKEREMNGLFKQRGGDGGGEAKGGDYDHLQGQEHQQVLQR